MFGFVLLVLGLLTAGAWMALREYGDVLTERGQNVAGLTLVTGFLGMLAFGGGGALAQSQARQSTQPATSISTTTNPSPTTATATARESSGNGEGSTTDGEASSRNWTVDLDRSDADVSTDTDTSGGSTYYKNCAAVRDAGQAPLTPKDSGYRSALDRDDDGLACE